MTTFAALDWLLIGGLITSFFAFLVSDRHSRRRDKELMDVVRRVDVMLYTWAANWGCPNTEMKGYLQEALLKNEQKYGRRKDDQ